ncbi:ABC transporter permease [Sphingobacterium wenxiniae]|uniref:Putative ABC transport system permease protein n=1 Tax=Sphingobacterium wenxiniae TaxID=683125 RepID=A0A1I6TUR9_9SPHI|nr:FtsX-like permease family protein [Sphingobacterium wenxiniae]SFS92727.1 putative ABC transport system permease protein [Sphingobacterium wenxiniae]
MIKNYFKIAWRSLLKNRFFSLLNILGLAVSLTVAILLITYGRQELSFNRQFKQEANIYRVLMQATAEYNHEKWSNLPNAVGPTMLSDIPEVKAFARLVRLDFTGFGSVNANEKNFFEKNIYLTDSSFFDIFDVEFTEGNKQLAFKHPKSVVISASKKENMFGNEPALNKKLIINQQDTLTISGVFQDLPQNSSFESDIFLNMMDSWMGKNVHWSNASYYTFCLLNSNANPKDIEQKTTAFIEKYVPKDRQYYTNFFLQPLSQVYLHSQDLRDNMSTRTGSIDAVKTVFILAMLIIFIACINYMNLATARSQKNAKEVGVNKVLGAHRSQIKFRFYMETGILSFFSICLGLLLATSVLSVFNTIIGTNIHVAQLFSLENIGIALLIWLVITLVGGSYPAFLMANIPSLSLMKNIITQSNIAQYIRKGLVVFQFTCSIVLIIGVIIISLQMRHVADKDLGYQPSNIVTIPIRSINTMDKFNTIKQSIQNLSGTASIATLQTFPGFGESGKTMHRRGETNEGLPVSTSSSRGPVVSALGLHLLAGTDLPEELAATDSTCYVLVNEVVSAYLGYENPQDAVGQRIPTEMSPNSVIKGVVRNFNFTSLKEAVGGYIYYRMLRPNESYRYFLVRYNTDNVAPYVAQIQQIFNQQLPDAAFDYQFLDEHIKNYYTAESRTNNIITSFSMLTIFIACLGLFGLAAFTAEQRKKEIGVRKVLGASIFKIVRLLSGNFVSLISIALLIAIPLGWWVFSGWLQDFNDKITIPWWSFALAGGFAIGIALMTVGYQAVKAAKANPVDSLRDE